METKPDIYNYAYNGNNISQLVKTLRNERQAFDVQLNQMAAEHEAMTVLYQEQSKTNLLVATGAGPADSLKQLKLEAEQLNAQIQLGLNNINALQTKLIEGLNNSVMQLKELQGYIEVELANWHRGQQLQGNGVTYAGTDLDQIQEWCELSLDQLCQYRQNMIKLRSMCQNNLMNQLHLEALYRMIDRVSNMIYRLVRQTFVIEKQPPQVMKTNTRFTTTVRLLVGAKLNLFLTPPVVNVHIISEHQAAIISNDTGNYYFAQNESAAGEIMNNTAVMEYQTNTRQLCGHFRNMQLKKIKRTEKKGTESVMDEKFALLFTTRITLSSDEVSDVQARVGFVVWPTQSQPHVTLLPSPA